MVITMAKLRMAHASTHGARKPPGPKKKERLNNGDNNGQATHGARKPPGPINCLKTSLGRQCETPTFTLNLYVDLVGVIVIVIIVT